MSSAWSIAELLAYRRTRFPLVRFGLLALFLTLATAATDETPMLSRAAQHLLLVLPWLFQFRLADDLADRERDRRDYPDRVLVRANPRPFVALLVLLTAGNTLLTAWLLPTPRWLEFLALTGLFLIWYTAARHLPFPAGIVVLLKYPALVYLLSDPGPGRNRWLLAEVLVLVGACFLAYEILHDKRSRSVPGMEILLALALVAMTATALVPAFPWSISWVGPGVLVLAWLFQRHQRRREPGPWPYAVFLVGLVWLVGNCLFHPCGS